MNLIVKAANNKPNPDKPNNVINKIGIIFISNLNCIGIVNFTNIKSNTT